MEKAIIFGATDTGRRIYEDIKNSVEVIFFVDQDSKHWGGAVDGIPIKPPVDIVSTNFDFIYVGVLTFYQEVCLLLKNMGVPADKIIGRYIEIPTYARIECLRNIREMLSEDGIKGNVAELGVFRGDFAREINRLFSDRILYLFDTFEGFSEEDASKEQKEGYSLKNRAGYFSNTSEQVVMEKMLYPEMVKIRKGYFPKTVEGLDDVFCFVNLDADLYVPTLAGLSYFYPRMADGGIILVHDYFSKAFKGAKAAVREFAKREKIKILPIGDTLSIAIRK